MHLLGYELKKNRGGSSAVNLFVGELSNAQYISLTKNDLYVLEESAELVSRHLGLVVADCFTLLLSAQKKKHYSMTLVSNLSKQGQSVQKLQIATFWDIYIF